MWRHYVLAGLKAMRTSRGYTVINVVGLSLGLAAAMLIFLYVRYETGFERWLPGSDRIHQIETTMRDFGPEPTRLAAGPRAAIDPLRRDFSMIEDVVGVSHHQSTIRVGDMPVFADFARVDPNFFDVFDLTFLHGDRATALRDPSSVVLTEGQAIRLFGRADVLGRTVEVEREGRRSALRVSAVIADIPRDSHLKFELIARFNPAEVEAPVAGSNWTMLDTDIFVRVAPGVDIDEINGRMAAWERRHLGSDDAGLDFRFSSLRGVHLAPPVMGVFGTGDPVALKAFSIIAVLILLIAAFNYTNLATARASLRAREIGVRKVLGAKRSQLITQFLLEALLLAGMSLLIALALVEVTLPFFNRLLERDLGIAYLGEGGLLLPAITLTALVGLSSGVYPAVYLSRFRPERILRASASPVSAGSSRLRNLLVVMQFAAAIALTICAAVVYAQTLHVQQSDRGFRPQNLLTVANLGRGQTTSLRETLRREIEALPGVTQATLTSTSPRQSLFLSGPARRPDATETVNLEWVSIDQGFAGTMGASLVAGRALSDTIAADVVRAGDLNEAESGPRRAPNILLNETAVRHFDFPNSDAAIGRQIVLAGNSATIVGVLRDIRFESLRDAVEPQIFLNNPANFQNLVIRFDGVDPLRLKRDVQRVWRRVAAEVPFEAEFAEDALAGHSRSDEVRGQVFAIAAALAIAIACLGLFGLAAFAVERRRLEIAVRKVFGAETADIVKLMAWQFSRPVLAANLIAWPISWWLMRDWLNGFGDRVSLHLGWFAAAGLLAFLMAMLTVGGHALRASQRRPIAVLRYE